MNKSVFRAGRSFARGPRSIAALSAALLATTALAAPALAQTQPAHRALDANGVDLTNGGWVVDVPEGSIGSGPNELALFRRGSQSQWDNIRLDRGMNGTSATIEVTIGAETETFTGTISSLSSTRGNGARIVQQGESYVLIARDGTRITFGDPTGNPQQGYTNMCRFDGMNLGACELAPTSIVDPSGRLIAFEHAFAERCDFPSNFGDPAECQYFWRLSSVANGADYRIAFAYEQASDGGGSLGQTPSAAWQRRTGASFHNDAAGPSPLGSVAYSYSSSGVTEVTDMAGRSWRFTLGSGGLAIRRPGETTDSILYSGTANSMTVTRDGVTTSYARTVNGSTATMTITNALNQQTVVVSDLALGRPISVTDPLNRTTSYQYDSSGRPTRTTAPDGSYVQLSYDARGNVTQTQAVARPGSGDAPITTSASYAATCDNPVTCNSPTSTTDARGNVTDYVYDPEHGGLRMVTGPAPAPGAARPQLRYIYTLLAGEYRLTGTSTCVTSAGSTASHDTEGNLILSAAPCAGAANEVRTTIGYDGAGNVASVSSGAGDGSLTAAQAMTYNALGDLVTVDGPLAGAADTTRLRYNAARELIGAVGPDPDGAGPLQHQATRTIINGQGLAIRTDVGTVASQSDADWTNMAVYQSVETDHDADARPTVQRLTAGGTTFALSQTSYDALGRPECNAVRMNPAAFSSLPPSACTQGTAGAYGPDRISRTVYDALGRPTQLQVAVGTADQANEATATYTPNGQLETLTDGENNRTTYEYDGHGRLHRTRFPVAAVGANQSSTTDYEQLDYDPAGNVVHRRTRDDRHLGYGYDALGRLTLVDTPNHAPGEHDRSYGYDNLGRMTSASQPAHALAFGYDALGRMTSETGPHGAVTSSYDAGGRRTRLVHAGGAVNYAHDLLGRVISVHEDHAGGANSNHLIARFWYNDRGRINTVVRGADGGGSNTTFYYDAASRVSVMANDAPGEANDFPVRYGYNPAGQITSREMWNDAFSFTAHSNGSVDASVNGLNQLTSDGGTAIQHDGRGNTTSDGSTAYAYDAENRMVSASGARNASLGYDPLGRLYQVTGSGGTTRFVYDGMNMVAEYDGGGQLQRRHVQGQGVDEHLATYEGSSLGIASRRYPHQDERGSVIALLNADGSLNAVNRYDAYGQPQSGNAGRFQYTGQMWLPEVGLYHFRARMYDARTGRFMQPDPIGYGDGMNQYNAFGGDPVNRTDPSGTLSIIPILPAWVFSKVFQDVVQQVAIDAIIVTGHRQGGFHTDDGFFELRYDRSNHQEWFVYVYEDGLVGTETTSRPITCGGRSHTANTPITRVDPNRTLRAIAHGHQDRASSPYQHEPYPGAGDGVTTALRGVTNYQFSSLGVYAIRPDPTRGVGAIDQIVGAHAFPEARQQELRQNAQNALAARAAGTRPRVC